MAGMMLKIGKVVATVRPEKLADGSLALRYTLASIDGSDLGSGSLHVDVPAIRAHAQKVIHVESVGWSLAEVKRKVNRVTKKAVVKKIAREVTKLAAHPMVQKGALAAAAIYPPLGIPVGVAVKTAKLYQNARAGNLDAKKGVARILSAAQSGDPKAQKLATALVAFDAASKKGHSVSGWIDKMQRGYLVNIPYRTNLAAGELDRKNPKHKLRGLYNLHLDAVAKGAK